jgi:hypothetical protein
VEITPNLASQKDGLLVNPHFAESRLTFSALRKIVQNSSGSLSQTKTNKLSFRFKNARFEPGFFI